jgi:uncharacterized membrane protein YeiB
MFLLGFSVDRSGGLRDIAGHAVPITRVRVLGLCFGLLAMAAERVHAVTAWEVVILAVQVVVCQWWSRRFRFGAMEWLWRSLTYLKWQPLRLRSDSTR